MEYNDFEKIFFQEVEKIDEKINVSQIKKFYQYMNLLKEWNKKINLTAIVEEKEIITKHFIDSLTINKYLNKENNIIDVGTGAGFPGIPIKIINENLEVDLLDSLNKRINFLNEVIKECHIEKINTIHSRIEDFAIKNREKYDVATSRAVARMSVLLEYLLPVVKKDGICICMKSNKADEEIKEAKKALEILGGKIEKIEKFNLPGTDYERSIIIIRKIKSTPKNYPRKAGIPAKNPLI